MSSRVRVPAVLQRQWARVPTRLRLPVAVYATCQVIYLAWWAAFFPGLASYDSITYIWEVTTSNWIDDHSILYDSLVWLSLQVSGDIWPLTLLQTIAISLVLAYTCVALRDLGVRGRWSALAAVCVAVVPSTGSLTEFIWKDAAFGISALLAFAAAARLIARRIDNRSWVRDRWFYVQIGVLEAGFLGVAFFRNSSVDALIAALPLLLLAMRNMRLWITALVAGTTVLYLVVNFLVYPALGVKLPGKDSYYSFNYADIAVAYGTYPYTFTKHDKEVMEKVAPLSAWGGKAANCWDVDWTMAALNRPEAVKINDQLMTIWDEVLKRTPQSVVQGRLCRSQIAWGIFPGPANLEGTTLIAWPQFSANLWGQSAPGNRMAHSKYLPVLKSRPPSDTLHKAGIWYYMLSMSTQTQWLLWRGAFWSYSVYALVIALARKRRSLGWPYLGLAGISFGLQMAVIAANPAALSRYIIPAMMIGFMTMPMISLLSRTKPPTEAELELDRVRPGDSGDGPSAAPAPAAAEPAAVEPAVVEPAAVEPGVVEPSESESDGR